MITESRTNFRAQGQGLKDPCSHHVGGGGAVQDVQEHNVHQFYQLILKGETKNFKLCYEAYVVPISC